MRWHERCLLTLCTCPWLWHRRVASHRAGEAAQSRSAADALEADHLKRILPTRASCSAYSPPGVILRAEDIRREEEDSRQEEQIPWAEVHPTMSAAQILVSAEADVGQDRVARRSLAASSEPCCSPVESYASVGPSPVWLGCGCRRCASRGCLTPCEYEHATARRANIR